MTVEFLVLFIQIVSRTFTWVVIGSALLSFVLSPYHPIRETLDRIVAPFLNPIRNLMPSAGGLDFSPLILILIVNLVSQLLVGFLLSL